MITTKQVALFVEDANFSMMSFRYLGESAKLSQGNSNFKKHLVVEKIARVSDVRAGLLGYVQGRVIYIDF